MTPATFTAARKRAAMTQRKFAAWLDVNPRTVRRWEKGEAPIPVAIQRAMSALEQESSK